jgi:AcrR family transcriptional regulator
MNPDSTSEPKAKLRDRLRTATRDAILHAASEVFAADGAANARVEDIAARAGVAVGTVYNYFGDRAALVRVLLDIRTAELFTALDDNLRQRSTTGRTTGGFDAAVEGFVTALVRHFDVNRGLLTALLDDQRAHGMDAKAVSRRRTVLEQILSRAEKLMAKGVRAQALRKGDPAVYAVLLVGMVRGMVLNSLWGRRDQQLGDVASHITRIFMHGAAAR